MENTKKLEDKIKMIMIALMVGSSLEMMDEEFSAGKLEISEILSGSKVKGYTFALEGSFGQGMILFFPDTEEIYLKRSRSFRDLTIAQKHRPVRDLFSAWIKVKEKK
jgi:hypothetical protein